PVVSDLDMLAMVLGCRLAENIFPEPLKTKIKEATAQQLTTNANELLDSAYLESLMVCSRMTVNVSPEIFATVFDAWKSNEALDIEYTNAAGEHSARRIDPHIIAFYDGAWFIKAYCHLKRKVWIFSLHRISSASGTGKFFEPDRHIIEETRAEGLFEFTKIKDIILRCDNRIAAYARDYMFHPGQKVLERDDGTFDLVIPHASKDDIIRWIMWQAGQVEVVRPKTLRSLIAGFAHKIIQRNDGNR
ncbi:MAG: WYL domain-containing protein, partial [Victivallales bacterium]|nr:WYL domain-containing protein [Victivallales bacterium]